MTDDTTRGDGIATADPAELEQRLAQAEERLTFYTSFDKLIQDNIARSSELMRDALALREQAIADMRRAEAELARVQEEASQAVAAANAQAVDERRRFSETLLALQGELGGLQEAAAAIGRQVGTVLGELGAAEFVPIAWMSPAETVDADAAIEEAVEGSETGPDGEAWQPLAHAGDEPLATGDLIAYQGIGTGELSMAGAGDDSQVAEFFPSAWETDAPAYPTFDEESAAGEDAVAAALEPESAPEAETADGWAEPVAEVAEVEAAEGAADAADEVAADEVGVDEVGVEDDAFASLEDFEAAIAALEADEPVGADDAIVEESDQVAETVDGEEAASADDSESVEAVDEIVEVEAAIEPATDEDLAVSAEDETVLEAEVEPSVPGPDDVDVYAAAAYEAPATFREEGFLGGFAAEADQDGALAAETAYESSVAVETADEPRAVMVLVHGVPRAAAALSLQRHLAGLAHVEGVEAREYAEGILRLQVTSRSSLALDDLRAWDGGAELEPVHVQDDVIEVRLPGAAGF